MDFDYIYVVIFILFYKNTRRANNFPHGPPRLPIIGAIPYIRTRTDSSKSMSMLIGVINPEEKYGQYVGCYASYLPNVVMADFETTKKFLKLMH